MMIEKGTEEKQKSEQMHARKCKRAYAIAYTRAH